MISRIEPDKHDNAVSPVIGTILLVAITVVLIAIIAAVMMGLSGNIGSTKNVGLSVQPFFEENVFSGYINHGTYKEFYDIHGVVLTFYGGEDIANLRNVTVKIDNYPTYNASRSLTGQVSGKVYYLNNGVEVGKPYKFRAASRGNTYELAELNNVPVVVTGTFTDGSEQVLYKANLNIPSKNNIK